MQNYGKCMFKKFVLVCSLFLLCAGLLTVASCKDETKGNDEVILTFVTNGGQELEAMKGKPGEALQLPIPVFDGYSFAYWAKDELLENKFESSVFPEENMTLYAKWLANYRELTVVYHNGLPSLKKKVIETTAVSLENPTLEGCRFAGWYTDEPLTLAFNGTMPKSDLTVYAKWEKEEDTAFVSPKGNPQASGSWFDPLDFDTALARMKRGAQNQLHQLYLKSGTYEFSTRKIVDTDMSGTVDSYQIIAGVDGDSLPIFDYSQQEYGQRGFDIRADYVHLSNLIVERAGAYGIYVGGSHNIVENCVTRYNRNTGLGIARWDDSQNTLDKYPSDNLILKCTSHDNFDYNNGGEDADGFSAKLTVGHNNIFDSCIAFANSDDGWDLYSKSSSGNTGVTKIINCIAFRNGFLSDIGDENNTSSYNNGRTRDGDGNGFKLGGEVMYTNAYLENCISFENGAHGYTDNSNPGILNLKNCTAYNNGLFEAGRYQNFNLARTTDSLNVYDGLLSIATSNYSQSCADEFRGPISNSLVLHTADQKLQYYAILDVINGNSRIEELSGTPVTVNAADVFEKTDVRAFYVQTVASADEVHKVLRNQDGSINLGSYLKINDGALQNLQLDFIGGRLAMDSWEEYRHHESLAIPQGATADTVVAYQIYNQLFVMCNEEAVYEDLDLYKTILGHPIHWTSSHPDIVTVDLENPNPKDASKGTDTYYWGIVKNPSSDQQVTLTATISIGDVELQKEFKLLIKALKPMIGDIEITYPDVILQGEPFDPVMTVYDLNGRSDDQVISSENLVVTTRIFYEIYGQQIEIEELNTEIPGTYKIEYSVALKDSDQMKTETIVLDVVNIASPVEIKEVTALASGGASVRVKVNWATGKIFAIAVAKGSPAPTALDVITANDYQVGDISVEVKDFTSSDISSLEFTIGFANAAYGDYTYYLVVQNENGLSEVASVDAVAPTYISTAQELYDVLHRDVLNTEYIVLSNDIDLKDVTWDMAEVTFAGIFDGAGYTISNLTIQYDGVTYAGLFYETNGALIQNVTLKEVQIQADNSTGAAALIGKASATNVSNVKIRNVRVSGVESIGGLIGQTSSGNVTLKQVSVINESSYLISASKRYAGGLVGCFMGGPSDDSYNEIIIENAEVVANVECGKSGYVGGFVGRVKGNEARYLKIEKAVYEGTLTGKYAGTTTGGSDKNVLGCRMEFNHIVSFAKIATDNKDNGVMNGRLQSNTIQGVTTTNTSWVELSSGANAKPKNVKADANQVVQEETLDRAFYQAFDLTDCWSFNEETARITLK